MSTSCVICGDSQEYVVCYVCSTQLREIYRGIMQTPETVADLPAVRTAAFELKRQISQHS